MTRILRRLLPCVLALPLCVLGQQPAAPTTAPDAVTFVNGDRMSGQIVGTTAKGLVFKSILVGEITIEWSSIRDVHSEHGFAWMAGVPGAAVGNSSAPVVAVAAPPEAPAAPAAPVQQPQPVQVARAEATRAAPAPAPAPTPAIPVAPAPEPEPKAARLRSFPGHTIFAGWQGVAAAGVSYVGATQSFLSFTPSVNLMRTWPKGPGAWPVRSRTFINFATNYSKQTQHGDTAYFDPTNRTVVIPGAYMETFVMHGELVQDYFLFSRFFVQGGASFDHSYAQSLDLLQSYGGGLGYVVYRTKNSEFDLRAGVGWAKQLYDGYPNLNASYIAGRFYQSYTHTFGNGMSFSEQGGVRPAWTDPRYLFAGGNLSFNMPIYKRLNMNVSSFDFWSRTPPPLLKKNVFQVALGVSYAF